MGSLVLKGTNLEESIARHCHRLVTNWSESSHADWPICRQGQTDTEVEQSDPQRAGIAPGAVEQFVYRPEGVPHEKG